MNDVKTYGTLPPLSQLPSLVEFQFRSLSRFQNDYLAEIFEEFSPIQSYDQRYTVYFPTRENPYRLTYWFDEPRETPEQCLRRRKTYAAPLYVKIALHDRNTDTIKTETVFFGEVPLLSPEGTFIINGVERIAVSQITRAPGVYYERDAKGENDYYRAVLIPERGRWWYWEVRRAGYIVFIVEGKRPVPATLILRALAARNPAAPSSVPFVRGDQEEILKLYADLPQELLVNTFKQEDLPSRYNTPGEAAIVEIYRRARPGDTMSLENARNYMTNTFFNSHTWYLGHLGRRKINQKFNSSLEELHLTEQDIINIIRGLIEVHAGLRPVDDIDHLGNRRIRGVGEQLVNPVRAAFRKIDRLIKERMTIIDSEKLTPTSVINIRPFVSAIKAFFGASQHVQLAEQTNLLSEITHKRTITALGPGGLSHEQAGFEVRDVHHSHYGRICPIETPEGLNIGLINRLALFARVNDYGLIETPYRRVKRSVKNEAENLLGRTLAEDILNAKGQVIAQRGTVIDKKIAKNIERIKKHLETVPVMPYVSDEIEYLPADVEDNFVIGPASVATNAVGEILPTRVDARHRQRFVSVSADKLDFVELTPVQVLGVSASLIPFIEHDEASRALMGSNMQRQAVPLLKREAPIVGTGIEDIVAHESKRLVRAEHDGEVVGVTAKEIHVRSGEKIHRYPLRLFEKMNQNTCLHHQPCVIKGQKVKKGDVLADTLSSRNGTLALGRNVLVAFLSWGGYNYEDAVIISERLVKEDLFTSIHIEEYDIDARDTKLGSEEFSRDIPNLGFEELKDLDENGVVRIGAYVRQGDILVGKVAPKGEKELSPEERLLRAIFGEKMREVRDVSLRMPHGEEGVVIDSYIVSREEDSNLPAGVLKRAVVRVAQKRKITVGDKMAGRHGNKGVVAKIVPEEDMPFLEDGTPVDIILNPLGVPSRMNIGQILETHLGWVANRLGFRAVVPSFGKSDAQLLEAELCRAWLIDKAEKEFLKRAWAFVKEHQVDVSDMKDEIEVLEQYLLTLPQLQSYDSMRIRTDSNYRRHVVLEFWLREQKQDPAVVMSDDRTAIQFATETWLRERGIVPNATTLEDLRRQADALGLETGDPPPYLGKMRLIDGQTGEPFEGSVTVGYMHMLKLIHLVDDKVHARSTGPYSIVTQQPLGGRARFGGQRLGEMEVWALEAYGAAHTLQEMLTIKSDDVEGRIAAYDAIIKNKPISVGRIPESFKVLVKELQSLGISVEVITESGQSYDFGKGKPKALPKIGMTFLEGGDD